jgi:hypothetical protein
VASLLIAWAPAEALPGFLALVLDNAAGPGAPLSSVAGVECEVDETEHGGGATQQAGEVAGLCRALLAGGELWELPALLPAWPQAAARLLDARAGPGLAFGAPPPCASPASAQPASGAALGTEKGCRRPRGCMLGTEAAPAGAPGGAASSGAGAGSLPSGSARAAADPPAHAREEGAALARELQQTLHHALQPATGASALHGAAECAGPGSPAPPVAARDQPQGPERLLAALRLLAAAPPAGYLRGAPAAELARLALRLEAALLRHVARPGPGSTAPGAGAGAWAARGLGALACLAATRARLASLLLGGGGCDGGAAGAADADAGAGPGPSARAGAAHALVELGPTAAAWLLGACDAVTRVLARRPCPDPQPDLGDAQPDLLAQPGAHAALQQLFEATGAALRGALASTLQPAPQPAPARARGDGGAGEQGGSGESRSGALLAELVAQAERRARALPEQGRAPALLLGRWLLGLRVEAAAGALAGAVARGGGADGGSDARARVQLVAGALPMALHSREVRVGVRCGRACPGPGMGAPPWHVAHLLARPARLGARRSAPVAQMPRRGPLCARPQCRLRVPGWTTARLSRWLQGRTASASASWTLPW